jgi:hypothetical protein
MQELQYEVLFHSSDKVEKAAEKHYKRGQVGRAQA